MTIRELPLGDPGFAEIIDQNLLYADKTRYIHELYRSTEKHYFLSRPRRFGKTLLLDTIKVFFAGDRSRFRYSSWMYLVLSAYKRFSSIISANP